MSARMQYPLSQRRHTNIAVVRYQKNGVRLEIACYKNKVISYRAGTEDRLDEVLQVDRIFSNVGRGYVASKEDIAAVFGDNMTEEQAIEFMLEHGELQVAQQERTAEIDEISKDVAFIISQKCVNTTTQRPFPTMVIEQALKSIGAAVKLDQPVKKQALGLIHQLVESQVIPIARANMKVRCLTPTEAGIAMLDQWCQEKGAQVMERKTSMADGAVEATGAKKEAGAGKPQHSLLVLLQPNLFRELDTLVKNKLPTGSSMHMVDAAVTEIGEGDASAIARGGAATTDSLDLESSGLQQDNRPAQRPYGSRRAKGDSLATSTANGDDDSEESGNATGGGGRRKGKKEKKGKKGAGARRSSTGDDDGDEADGAEPHLDKKGYDDEDSDDGDNAGRKGKGAKKGKKGKASKGSNEVPPPAIAGCDALTAQLVKLGLDPANDLVGDGDSDDEGRGKGKKGKGRRGNKGGKAPPQPAPDQGKGGKQQQQQQGDDADKEGGSDSDSDDDLVGNRRQRKRNTQQQQQQQQQGAAPSDDEFDYGDDDEEEAN